MTRFLALAGFLIGRNHIIIGSQWLASPTAMVKIEHAPRLLCKGRIARENPTAVRPRLDGVRVQPPPHSRIAYRGHDAPLHGLACYIAAAQTREGQAQFVGKLTRQRLNLHDDPRGKTHAGAPAWAGPPTRPIAPRRSACAICLPPDAAAPSASRSPYYRAPRRRRAWTFHASPHITVTYIFGRYAPSSLSPHTSRQCGMGFFAASYVPP